MLSPLLYWQLTQIYAPPHNILPSPSLQAIRVAIARWTNSEDCSAAEAAQVARRPDLYVLFHMIETTRLDAVDD